jgi:hypothetical protein
MIAVASPCLLHEGPIAYRNWLFLFLVVDDVVQASEEFSFFGSGKETQGFSSDGRRQAHCPVYFNVRNDMQFFKSRV